MTIEPTAPPPRANADLLGHEAVEAALRQNFDAGRLPHALLLSGPRGIGKATLAFRLARYVLSAPGEGVLLDMFGAPAAGPVGGLAVPPTSDVFSRVASGGHADLRTIERAYDTARRRLRGEIVIDDVRKISGLLRRTAGEDGWRVVIIDGADEMNRNAANALLKILEEPPQRALLILVAHSAGRLLPTIRSRCRHIPLSPLPDAVVRDLLSRYCPDLDGKEAEVMAALAEGSIGRALELTVSGGVELASTLTAMLTRRGGIDVLALYDFAERLARPDAEDSYRTVEELLGQHLARLAIAAARRGTRAEAARWARVRGEIGNHFARANGLNLDKKQAIMGAVFAIERAAA